MDERERMTPDARPAADRARRSPTTTPARSRSSRGSRPSASARRCTSARRARPGCTTSSTRSSTTRSTRPRRASATRIEVVDPHRQLGHGRSTTAAASPSTCTRARRQAGGRGRADHAARRRQVRQRRLQGLGRPARRRRLGGQRAVRAARARDLARRRRPTSRLTSAASPSTEFTQGPAPPSAAARKITFKPDPQIFEELVFSYDTLAPAAARAGLPQQGPDDHARATSAPRSRASRSSTTRAGIVEFVQHLNKARQVLHPTPIYIEGGDDGVLARDRDAVERLLQRDDLLLRQLDQHGRGRHAPGRLQGRADAHDQQLPRRRRTSGRTPRTSRCRARTAARG